MARHAVRGVIWYQGEQNAQNAVQARWHELAFPHLVADFRENWKQPELPFYYVQLPGFGSDEWPAFREQQRQFLRIPHSGMAVTIDLGDAANIHPKDKPPIGERLARLALKNTYGKTVVASGPSPHNASAIGAGAVRIQFTDSAKGLSSTANPTPGFELAGADKQFVPAVAILSGRDEVRVTAKAITQPKYVRYAWAGFPRPLTLINSEGLPTGPFVEELQD
jgi:sialate O-acetylesterase